MRLTLTSPVNPFSKREAHSRESVITYKVLTIVTWLLSFITTLYYSFYEPHDPYRLRHRIRDQNEFYHNTAFYLNFILIYIYW